MIEPSFFVNVSKHPSSYAPRSFYIGDVPVSIGRKGQVKMDTGAGRQVSKYHASIIPILCNNRKTLIIEDQNSTNGTYVNGEKIKKYSLTFGDEISFGDESMDLAECRYIYCDPSPIIEFSDDYDPYASLSKPEECPICFQESSRVHRTPCGHAVCNSCLNQWFMHCSSDLVDYSCPVCRSHIPKDIGKDAILTDNKVMVTSHLPLLEKIGLRSVDQIKDLNIFNKWGNTQKTDFWESLRLIGSSRAHFELFMYLVGARRDKILQASKPMLYNAAINLEGKPSDDIDSLRCEVFGLIAIKLRRCDKLKMFRSSKRRISRIGLSKFFFRI